MVLAEATVKNKISNILYQSSGTCTISFMYKLFSTFVRFNPVTSITTSNSPKVVVVKLASFP